MAKKEKLAPAVPGLDLALRDQLELERQRTVDAIAKAGSFPLDTPAQRDKLAALANHAADRIKELETERTKVTQPLNQVLRTVNSWFKPLQESYEAFRDTAKRRLLAHQKAMEAERSAALEVIQEGAGQAPDEAFAVAHRPIEVPAGMASRVTYKVQVDDPALIPRAFLVPDLRLIKAELQAGRAVPGCSWVPEESLVKARG